MWLVAKIIAVVVVVGLFIQQAALYHSTIIRGGYFDNASIGNVLIAGVGWPLLVCLLALVAIRAIIRFNPKSLI